VSGQDDVILVEVGLSRGVWPTSHRRGPQWVMVLSLPQSIPDSKSEMLQLDISTSCVLHVCFMCVCVCVCPCNENQRGPNMLFWTPLIFIVWKETFFRLIRGT